MLTPPHWSRFKAWFEAWFGAGFKAWLKPIRPQHGHCALPDDIKTLQQGMLGGAHKQRRLWQCEFVALDLETSGLSSRQHHIVSSASVLILPKTNTSIAGLGAGDVLNQNITQNFTQNITQNTADIAHHYQLSIQLGSAAQQLLQPLDDHSVGQSALIHGYHDRDLQQGIKRSDYLRALLQRLQGRVLLCHNADIEVAFLQQAYVAQFGYRLPLLAIDTMRIEKQRLAHQPMLKYDDLTLSRCLARYQLPQSRSHDALSDAYSCALLWLAQSAGQLDTPLADWATWYR
jgi:DNA polymerase III epsilon subunit-like protein